MPNAGSVGSSTLSGAAAGSAFGPWGTVIGAGVGLIGGLLNKQKAPKGVALPPYQPVDLAKEQQGAINANAIAEGDIEALLARANTFNQSQASGLMEQAVPGWSKLSQKFLQNADSMISNPYDVPKDVENNLARIASERGISSGARGQFSQFSLLRDLGVNALNYGQSRISQGQSLLQLVGSLSPKVSPLSPLSFYVTPAQAAGVAANNSAGVAGVAAGNQGVAQGVENAGVAAGNWNRNNMWQSVSDFAALTPTFIPRKDTVPTTTYGPGGAPSSNGIVQGIPGYRF